MEDFNQDRLPDLGSATVQDRELTTEEKDPRAEWHAQRLGKLTSSRFEDMMQKGKTSKDGTVNPFGRQAMIYIYEKVAELLINAPHIVTSQAMEWGTEMEIQAIKTYEELSGNTVKPAGFVAFGEYAGGSPDGIVGEEGIIEVKCPYNPANHVETVITNEVPDKHQFQIQGNLMVTGRKWCDFISYDPRVQEPSLQIFIQRVERNEQVIQAIRERIVEVSLMVLELYKKLKKEETL